jgi:hypothetical protein
MSRKSQSEWGDIRVEREAGVTFKALSLKYGVSDAAIVKRSQKENWGDGSNIEAVIARKVSEKVSKTASVTNPAKRAAAIDAEAERRAEVERRQRDEWEKHLALTLEAMDTRSMEAAKFAKIMAEVIMIRQNGERKAWRLDVMDAPHQQQPMVVIAQVLQDRIQLPWRTAT